MINTKKVVVLMEKYCDLNPSLGTTSAYSNVVGSLISAGVTDLKILHYDEYLFQNQKPIDDFLIESLIEDKPDLLAVSYYPFANDPRNVKIETLRKLKNAGIPVVLIWFDLGHRHIKELASSIGDNVSLHVVVDTFDIPSGNFVSMWVPQDERIFKEEGEKDINLSFVGTTAGYHTRGHYIHFLNSMKRDLYVSGGQREHRLTIEEYASVLKRSKITLNFPDKADGTVQAKCRIYESMLCGALLFEKENNAIIRWFAPMIDYVPFTNEADLLHKIDYYLAHPEEREKITYSAKHKMKNNYSSFNWWNIVLERATK